VGQILKSQFIDMDGESVCRLPFQPGTDDFVVLVSGFGGTVFPQIDDSTIEAGVGLPTGL
jgi:hypothetical protein